MGRNGTTQTHYLSFSGTNRQRWDFISKYMINKGMIDSHSIEEQRNFLKAHPEVQEEVFQVVRAMFILNLQILHQREVILFH